MPQHPDLVPYQFGDPELTTDEAYAACGPAAAVAFARYYGRNPTLKEAVQVAKGYGWTPSGGMNGVGNQKRLLDAMGIPAELDTNPSADRITREAAAGRPVQISTGVHYYVADDYDPQTGQLHVGASGRARKGGGEWMTLQQISQRDGGINGALYLSGDPGGPQYQTVSDTTGGGTVAGPQAGTAQQQFDRIVAAKGTPTRVEDITKKPTSILDDEPTVRTQRIHFADNTYVDVDLDPNGSGPNGAGGGSITGISGSALATAAKPDKPKGEIVGTNPTDQWIVRQLPDGTISRTPNPNYVPPKPPKEPAKPNNKTVVTRDGKSYIYDPDTNTFTPATGLPDEKPKNTTHVIGGRIYTLDPDGNVVGTADMRTPEERQAQALAIQKAQQDLLTKSQLAQQNEAQTIEHIRSMMERGEVTPEEGNAWMAAVRRATAMGTTAFDLAKQEDDAKRARQQMGATMLNTRLETAGSLGSSLASSALSAAGKAMYRPGQTSLGVDPLALAATYTQQQADAAKADPIIAALLAGAQNPTQPQQPLAAGLK